MFGLLFSQVMLFAAAALIGFGAGWRLYALVNAGRRRAEQRDIEQLRAGLTDAQVRRARTP